MTESDENPFYEKGGDLSRQGWRHLIRILLQVDQSLESAYDLVPANHGILLGYISAAIYVLTQACRVAGDNLTGGEGEMEEATAEKAALYEIVKKDD